MKIKTIASVCLLLLLLFLVVSDALAMSSTNYKLDWYVLLNGSGGSQMSSTHYKVDVTVGQTGIGSSSGTNFDVGLGYWYGLLQSRVLLPLILR